MKSMTIGIISDTHKLIRPHALEALKATSMILHAGDIGNTTVIEALEQLAPVTAIRGNCDKDELFQRYPKDQVIEINGKYIYMLHDIQSLDLDPLAAGFDAVIFGHSHKPSIQKKNGILFINPGSAGPRRFKLPVTLALLDIKGEVLTARIIELDV